MADNLTIFGTTYNNVTGIKATDTNGIVQTFTKGGSPAPTPASSVNSGVQFIDYDGTLLHSYSTADALALSALPSNPSHTGLTAQGWNWSLTNIKAYLTKYPNSIVNVGQMYVTDDGKTRIYIHLGEERKNPMLGVCPNGTVDVDWGDGTTHDTLTGTSVTTVKWTPSHNYASGGDYVIKLTVTGSMGFYGNSSTNQYSGLLRHASTADVRNRYYNNAVNKVEIGGNVTSIGNYAFQNCYSLASLIIPDGVTSIGNNAFYYCYSLASLIIPDGVTSIGNYVFYYCCSFTSPIIPDGVTSIGTGAFGGCYSITSLTIPDGVTSIESEAFQSCYSLTNLTIPDEVTSIGSNAFQYCYSLISLTIPDEVTSIGGSAFSYCHSLTSLTIPDEVTSIGSGVFNYCHALTSLTIPDEVTSIGNNAFNNCYSLTSLTIPDEVTSIGNNAFQNCYSITSLTIPDGVASIGTSAFANCYGIAEYHFLPTTPPTLSNTNAFTGISADCIIYVPYSANHSTLNAYKTASNWSTYASYMQEEPT